MISARPRRFDSDESLRGETEFVSRSRRSGRKNCGRTSGRISGTPSKAVAGAVKETSQGTFAKGVDTKWPETRRASNGLYDTLVAPSPTRQETLSVPPRG